MATSPELNPAFVLAPFNYLLANCQNNVLMGLRLVEKIEKFPEPTLEELQFFQLSIGGLVTDIGKSQTLFKKWVLINGFEDIHKCIRVTLERLYIFKTVQKNIANISNLDEFVKELHVKATNFYFDGLIKEITLYLTEPLKCKIYIESLNNARNCLVHTNAVVTTRHCNNIEKDKLKIIGKRFKYFFKNCEEEVIAEIGKPGPENAALMLGAEEFEIVFEKNSEIELNLKQFLDVLSTCVFINAEIDIVLKKSCA
jgi:hypothetical protein